MPWCNCCGKPLTDPVSVAQRIGPVCAMKAKENLAVNQSGNLFGELPNYSLLVDTGAKVLALVDHNDGRPTITNRAEEVVRHLAEQWPLGEYILIYQDTDGVWDRIHTTSGRFSHFSPIRVTEYKAAVAKVLSGR